MIKKLLLSVLFAAGVWIAALFAYAHAIVVLDQQARENLAELPAHSIVVLTGGTKRIAEGRRLLQEGKAGQMFISGVGTGVLIEDILPNLASEFACCVVLGRKAHDTAGNAREVEDWLENQPKNPFRRVLLVTAHYHLPRALWLFQDQMPQVDWLPYAVEPESFVLKDWYRMGLGWRLMSKELLKFVFVVVS